MNSSHGARGPRVKLTRRERDVLSIATELSRSDYEKRTP